MSAIPYNKAIRSERDDKRGQFDSDKRRSGENEEGRMDQIEQIRYLNSVLLDEMGEYRAQADAFPPDMAAPEAAAAQPDERPAAQAAPPRFFGGAGRAAGRRAGGTGRGGRGRAARHRTTPPDRRLAGGHHRLRADAIVNAANSALLGCFHPCHGCIDNAIHSAAGLQLREKCDAIMTAQGCPEPNGRAKLTRAYNLPARYVLHTVGPIIYGRVTRRDREELASCYRSCLELAAEHGLESVAFCCISTGEFHFPNEEAAGIAVETVTEFLRQNRSVRKVIFNVFKDMDAKIYRNLLGPDRAAEAGA